MNYYNEIDAKACAWLRALIEEGLIPKGEVDSRSIVDVRPGDLRGFVQCHFFAGIGGWPYALRLAEWPEDREAWTGSCPCQPLSCAGKQKGHADERHLWPAFYRLIAECNPAIVFGEQVAGKAGREWFAGVRADLEGLGYACGGAGLCGYSIKAPQERLRTYWFAVPTGNGFQGLQRCIETQVPQDRPSQALDPWHGAGNPFEQWEKLLAGACVCRLADGVSSELVVRPALRGFGNAIIPPLAAEFIRAAVESIEMTKGKL